MKILIVGTVGTGKTTLAKKISEEKKIKYYEIDSIVHNDAEGGEKRSEEEQNNIVNRINAESSWIIEGVLRKNLYYLLDFADEIIYLDTPKKVRSRRIFCRFVKQVLGIEKANYRPSLKMLKMMYKWSNEFEKEKISIESTLEKYCEKVKRVK